jgi:hypothetical protein
MRCRRTARPRRRRRTRSARHRRPRLAPVSRPFPRVARRHRPRAPSVVTGRGSMRPARTFDAIMSRTRQEIPMNRTRPASVTVRPSWLRRRLAAALFVVGALAAGGPTGCGYNRIQQLDERASQAQRQIEVQLKRRADLIPNLVSTVKGFAAQEQAILTRVADAQRGLTGRWAVRVARTRRSSPRRTTTCRGRWCRCSRSCSRTRSSRATSSSCSCRTSSRERRTGSRWREPTTTTRFASTTRSSAPSRAR